MCKDGSYRPVSFWWLCDRGCVSTSDVDVGTRRWLERCSGGVAASSGDGGDDDYRPILPGLTTVWFILLFLLLLFDLPRRAVSMVGPRISSVVSLVTWCALS